MSRDQIERYLNDPVVLAIAAAVAVLLIGLIVFLLARNSRRERAKEARIRQELLAMERERQLAAAIEQVEYRADAAETARDIDRVFREYLGVPVLAIYAGREGEEALSKITRANLAAPADAQAALRAQALPETVPASALNQYSRPQIARLASSQTQQPVDTSPLEHPASDRTRPQSAEAQQPGSESGAPVEQSKTDVSPSPSSQIAGDVMLIPWHGPFGWQGLVVTSIGPAINVETIARYQDILARLTDRLAVSLEFQRERAAAYALDERATRAASFSRALISCLEEPQPLASIAREVTKLVGADSAALWRVEPGTSMVRMVAAYGLKSAEFLPLPIGQGLAGSIIENGEPIVLEDAPADPRCIFPREARESGVVSYLGAPVIANDHTIGVVEAHAVERRQWNDGDLRSLKSAASIIAEVVRSTDTRGNRLRVESAYLGLSEALQRLRSPDEVMEASVEVLGHALGVSRAIVVELDEKGRPQPVKFEYRTGATSALGASFKAGTFDQLAASGAAPVPINDSRERSLVDADIVSALHILSELAVPIRLEGQTRGVIYLHQCDRVREWHREEIEFADRVARQLALSLSNVRSLESALKTAQAAREEARRAGEVTARAQAMITAMPEMVIGLDREGRLSFFNAAARDRLSLKSEDLGRMVELTESLTTSHEAVWDRVLDSDEVIRLETQLTRLPVQGRQDGETEAALPVSVSVAPLRNAKGGITGRLVVMSDVGHVGRGVAETASRVHELEQRLAEIERELNDARSSENQARAMLAKASAAEAKARAEADVLRRVESEAKQELEQIREDQARVQASARQLLDINRLKSEFIVNAGREIEASLQSVLGFAELLEQGSYGGLNSEQHEAMRRLYAWARRIRSDVDALIEYGSTRSRRLDEGQREAG